MTGEPDRSAIVIAGPTASGKSAAALKVASVLGGTIINADAMQVYADLRVLTARPTDEDLALAPHALYGVSPGDDPWSAGRFARAAASIVDDVMAAGGVPIVVGGTGLWLRALMVGLSPIPTVPGEVAAAALDHLKDVGAAAFRADVLKVDPAMAKLAPGDTQRHLRAWSVWKATGRPLSDWQAEPPKPLTPARFSPHYLTPPRPKLYANCDARFDAMLAAGALDEVEKLSAKRLPAHLPVMKAVGVPSLLAHLREQLSVSDAATQAKMDTRRLAKRQTTWFRTDAAAWPRFETAEALATYVLAKRPPASA